MRCSINVVWWGWCRLWNGNETCTHYTCTVKGSRSGEREGRVEGKPQVPTWMSSVHADMSMEVKVEEYTDKMTVQMGYPYGMTSWHGSEGMRESWTSSIWEKEWLQSVGSAGQLRRPIFCRSTFDAYKIMLFGHETGVVRTHSGQISQACPGWAQ